MGFGGGGIRILEGQTTVATPPSTTQQALPLTPPTDGDFNCQIGCHTGVSFCVVLEPPGNTIYIVPVCVLYNAPPHAYIVLFMHVTAVDLYNGSIYVLLKAETLKSKTIAAYVKLYHRQVQS